MWTHVDGWANAAKVSGVSISGPELLELGNGLTLAFEMLVKDFGAPGGTIVCTNYESVRPHINEIRAAGFTVSSFDPGQDGQVYSTENLIEILSEWGWTGEGPGPSWLLSELP